MTDPRPVIPHATQADSKKSKLPTIIAAVLALLLVGSAAALIIIGSKGSNTSPGESPVVTAPIDSASPKGLASGGAVFGEGMLPIETPALPAGSVPVPHEVDRAAGEIDIMVYVDYRCPHCMVFEQTNAATIEAAVATGQATFEVRPLTFMDRYAEGSAYSSRAAGVLACTVENQPESAWLIHSLLLNPNIQPSGEGPGHDNATLVELVDLATNGATPELKSCIEDETFVQYVGEVNDWTFAHPVPGAVDSDLMVQGTPLVVVAGIVYEGSVEDPAKFKQFLIDMGVAID